MNTYRVIDAVTHRELSHAVHHDHLRRFYSEKDRFPERLQEAKGRSNVEDDDEIITPPDEEPREQNRDQTDKGGKPANKTIKETKAKQISVQADVHRSREDDEDEQITDDETTKISNNDDEEIEDEDQNHSKSHRTDETQADEQNTDERPWYDAEKIVGTKMVNHKRYFKIKWADPACGPTWEHEEDVSDALQREYFTKHTKQGYRRAKRGKKKQ